MKNQYRNRLNEMLAAWADVVFIHALTGGANDAEWNWCFEELLRMGAEPEVVSAVADRAWKRACAVVFAN